MWNPIENNTMSSLGSGSSSSLDPCPNSMGGGADLFAIKTLHEVRLEEGDKILVLSASSLTPSPTYYLSQNLSLSCRPPLPERWHM